MSKRQSVSKLHNTAQLRWEANAIPLCHAGWQKEALCQLGYTVGPQPPHQLYFGEVAEHHSSRTGILYSDDIAMLFMEHMDTSADRDPFQIPESGNGVGNGR